jgi:hypothetical protein
MNSLLIWGGVLGALALAKWLEQRQGRPGKGVCEPDPLDEPLMWWSSRDALTLRQLLRSICIMGASGSGKTSGSGRKIRNAVAKNRRVSVVVNASKPEERGDWEDSYAEAGRRDDLVIFAPGEPHHFNLLDHETKNGADARELTECIMTVGETLNRNEGSSSGSREPFWDEANRRTIYNGVIPLQLAQGKVDAWDLQRFIVGAAQSPAEIANPKWQQGFHNHCLEAAYKNHKTAIQQHDYDLASQFWLSEYPNMDPKTRSNINAGVLGILHVYVTGIVYDLIGTTTTISPAVLDEGKSIVIDMPVSKYGAAGSFVNGAWKLGVQRHVLRRKATRDTPLTVLWIDEYQNHITSFDAAYLAECRSHHGCMVVLTQSLHSFLSSMKGTHEAESRAEALLSNFGTKVFHALGDDKSANYATSLIGKSLQTFVGGSMSPVEDLFLELTGRQKTTTSTQTRYEQIVQNNALFMLKTGGRANGLMTSAIVVRTGEPFSNGSNWMLCEFSQEG